MSQRTNNEMYRVPILGLARASVPFLPESEKPHYKHYTTLLGRGDFVGASKFASERTNPQLWIGQTSIYRNLRQAYAWADKIVQKGDSSAQEAAFSKFLRMESKCLETNRRFQRLARRGVHRLPSGCWYFHNRVRDRVKTLLGPLTASVYESILDKSAFGPGMTISSIGPDKTSIPHKLTDLPTVTSACLPVWVDYVSRTQWDAWKIITCRDDGSLVWRPRVKEVSSCRITFVPKTCTEDRTIAIEPSANVQLQLGVHHYLKERLKRFGLDITSNAKNRSLALRGSLDSSVATIDLSSASDTVSFEVVKSLVPSEWFQLLVALRSAAGSHRGRHIVFEKFSSMGNGVTFILETIIFAAIVYAVCGEGDGLTAVFGDDIIVPTPHFTTMRRVLRFYGFIMNPKKSFSSGPFRESCGMDAFDGVDVRAVYPKREYLNPIQIYALHNELVAHGFGDIAKVLVSVLPDQLRLFRPPGREAGAFHTEDPDLLCRYRTWVEDTQSWFYPRLTAKAETTRRVSSHARYYANLFSGGLFSAGAPLRGRVKLTRSATPGYC